MTCVHQGCLWCGKSSEVLGFPMQLEGAFAGRSAGDRVCMRLQCLLLLLLFLIILHRFSIQFLRLHLSIQWRPVLAISYGFFPMFFLDLCRKRTFRTSSSKRTNLFIVTLQSAPQGDPIFVSAFGAHIIERIWKRFTDLWHPVNVCQ